MRQTAHRFRVGRLVPLLSAMFALQSLTYCSGTTERGGGGSGTSAGGNSATTTSGGNSATATYGGYAGHTTGCLPECPSGCGTCGGKGGVGGDNGVAGYSGFAGHTAGCIGHCGGVCPPCINQGGASAGIGGDAVGGVDAGGQPDGGAPAAPKSAPRRAGQACYPLTGYEADACLPADDSLLPWLSGLPGHCTSTVTAGPALIGGPDGRACCYSVACREPAE